MANFVVNWRKTAHSLKDNILVQGNRFFNLLAEKLFRSSSRLGSPCFRGSAALSSWTSDSKLNPERVWTFLHSRIEAKQTQAGKLVEQAKLFFFTIKSSRPERVGCGNKSFQQSEPDKFKLIQKIVVTTGLPPVSLGRRALKKDLELTKKTHLLWPRNIRTSLRPDSKAIYKRDAA